MRKAHVLVVEDEAEIRQLIALHLRRVGYMVVEAADGAQAIAQLNLQPFDLVVLDWMLPQLSGVEITRWLRQRREFDKTCILFVTAKTEAENIAAGLDAGADDYLPKPFDTLVLMARVNALLRRHQWLGGTSSAETAAVELRMGELVLNLESHDCLLGQNKIELTRSEFRLLETLLQSQGKVLSREALIEAIQGEGVNVVGRTIDTHVFGLRKKLGAYAENIETIRGVGYRVRFPVDDVAKIKDRPEPASEALGGG